MLDAERFGSALAACMTLYNRPLTPDVLELYTRALARYDTDDVLRALEVHLLDPDVGQYAPKPADLVRRIAGSNTTVSARAWARVVEAVRLVGSWESVVFDDPLIHACVEQMGGWVKLCQMTEDEIPFRGKDFERLYLGYKQQAAIPHYPPRLIGKAEASNRERGFNVQPPIMIGNPAHAQLVHQGGSEKPPLLRELLPALALR
jgi:hypothetical protein